MIKNWLYFSDLCPSHHNNNHDHLPSAAGGSSAAGGGGVGSLAGSSAGSAAAAGAAFSSSAWNSKAQLGNFLFFWWFTLGGAGPLSLLLVQSGLSSFFLALAIDSMMSFFTILRLERKSCFSPALASADFLNLLSYFETFFSDGLTLKFAAIYKINLKKRIKWNVLQFAAQVVDLDGQRVDLRVDLADHKVDVVLLLLQLADSLPQVIVDGFQLA